MKILAINGGLPIRTKAFPCWPFFGDDEMAAANRVLQSGKVNYWTGEEGRLLETEFAASVGVNYAVAVMNCSVALEAALAALKIERDEEVIVTPRSYFASASCVVMHGARPIFADVDRNSQTITDDTIKNLITARTRAIIAVHLAGWPCEMDEIMALAKKHGLAVIEDCAQASGAFYKGRPIGSFGAAAAFSFCHDKIMTTGGEGGMVVTKDKDVWSRLWSYKDNGKSYDAVCNNGIKPGPSFKWLHESFGTNLRMTEMQAAIGRVQLRKMTGWIEIRKRNADILTKAFLKIPSLRVTVPPDHIFHSYYKYYVFIKPEKLKSGWNRDRVIAAINAEGIPCFTGSCSEIYLEKAFTSCGIGPENRLPVAEELGETAMMFFVHPTLSEDDMQDMVKAIQKVMAAAAK